MQLEDVAHGLRHLVLGAGEDHPVVHPGARERHAARGLGLRDLVLVVGEDEVGAAAVDREVEPEQAFRHRRALDMPAGPPLAPGRVPGRVLARLAGLPEREIKRVLLEALGARLLALIHVIGAAVRELAVALEAAHAKVDVALRLVGVAGVDQRPDEGDDRRDRLRRQRLVVGSSEAEPIGVLDVGGRHLLGEPLRRLARLAGRGVDLVVDVGYVDDQARVVPLVLEEALEQREDDVGAGVADVNAGVRRGAAGVDADDSVAALEGAQLAAERVVDADFAH